MDSPPLVEQRASRSRCPEPRAQSAGAIGDAARPATSRPPGTASRSSRPTPPASHCHRPAGSLDLDHILEHASGGKTSTDNLAPLCRRHHRAKTFTSWSYLRLGPAEHLWTSPHGYRFLTGPDGTTDLSVQLRDTG